MQMETVSSSCKGYVTISCFSETPIVLVYIFVYVCMCAYVIVMVA